MVSRQESGGHFVGVVGFCQRDLSEYRSLTYWNWKQSHCDGAGVHRRAVSRGDHERGSGGGDQGVAGCVTILSLFFSYFLLLAKIFFTWLLSLEYVQK